VLKNQGGLDGRGIRYLLGKQTKKHTQHFSEKLTGDVEKMYAYERYIELEFKQVKYQGVD